MECFFAPGEPASGGTRPACPGGCCALTSRWIAPWIGAFLVAVLAAPAATHATPAGIHADRYASIVLDARTGNVLSAANADEQRHPASLTKMMTLYMLFEAIRDGRVSMDSPIRFSVEAASRPPSKLGVPAGGAISAETAIMALVTRSANDVAAAVGEHLAGNEEAFARAMTSRARSLGMTRTTFRNASGLPDWEQITTARDMATLGRRLVSDFPQFYRYFGFTNFAHGRQVIRNHNGMLHTYEGLDGIKTGFINASGFNIVTSAQRDGVRLVGAVFGGTSAWTRNTHMAELLDEGFERMGVRPRTVALASAARPGPTLSAARLAEGRAAPAPR
ncbi:MAG: D-alanyl-D-alanine carboxypeptidase, partial [Acetobacteraceae bacterium]|nr:D-alanyl-D-alanine carboxypeptidase [Acetobacteraceae bacterium]